MVEFAEAPELADHMIRSANTSLWKDRTSGPPHVTDLVGCLRKAWLKRRGMKTPALDTEDHATLLAGHGHHAILENARFPEMQTEVHLQDDTIPVQGSADLIFVDDLYDPVPATGEIKTTRASAKKSIADIPHYIEQVASYCVIRRVNRAVVFILHLFGDYTGAKRSQFKAWRLYFSDDELQDWYLELKRRSAILLGDELPGLTEHAAWECGYCPFFVKNGGECEGGPGRMTWFSTQVAEFEGGIEGAIQAG